MKYCPKCGRELDDEAVMCTACGEMLEEKQDNRNKGLITAIKVFLIIACVTAPFGSLTMSSTIELIISLIVGLLPLAWCIPMTIIIFRKLKNNEPIGTALKVCTLIFVSLIAGIMLLCLKDNNY